MGAIEGVDNIEKERSYRSADWRFICCGGAFGVACSVRTAARDSRMQRVMACDEVGIGKKERN